jgi:hypothetical protein
MSRDLDILNGNNYHSKNEFALYAVVQHDESVSSKSPRKRIGFQARLPAGFFSSSGIFCLSGEKALAVIIQDLKPDWDTSG